MHKSKSRNMKQQGNSSKTLNNSTIECSNNCEEEEIAIDISKKQIMNEFKEEMYRQMSELKQDTNK
jgi:hypothetical protein